MKIVVDAMGSDDFPTPDVEGAILAAKEYGIDIILVGDKVLVEKEIAKHETTGLNIEVVHANEAINMEDKPNEVVRGKKDSSVHVGMSLVEDGKADAFVSMGNTGGVLAVATLAKIRRIKGVHRAAITSIVPFQGKHVILADIGANVDSKAEWLEQFALMGSIYSQKALKTSNPRVALLSNGEEETKGNQLIHEASDLLKARTDINFIGNIEPKDVTKAEADVIVFDGFVGNIFIKSLEAMGGALFDNMRQEAKKSLRGKIGGLLLRPILRKVYKNFDPFEIGGAPLLGTNGVVIIGHGRSNGYAIKNAIRQAKLAVEGNVVQAIKDGLS